MIINMGGNVFASKTTPGMSWNGLGAKYSSAFFSVKFEAKEMIHFLKKYVTRYLQFAFDILITSWIKIIRKSDLKKILKNSKNYEIWI